MDGFSWSFAVYVFCLVVGLGFAIVSGFLGGILHAGDGGDAGLDHDVSVDHDVSADHDMTADHSAGDASAVHLSPLSPPIMSTFLTGFGFFGMVAERGLRFPWFLSAPLAAALSIGLAVLVFIAVGRFMSSSQGSSQIRFSDLVGIDAEVVTPIPAAGVGEIAFDAPTGRTSCPARSETGAPIAKHSMVTITQVVGSVAMVRPTIDEQLRQLAVEGQHEQTAEETAHRAQTEQEKNS